MLWNSVVNSVNKESIAPMLFQLCWLLVLRSASSFNKFNLIRKNSDCQSLIIFCPLCKLSFFYHIYHFLEHLSLPQKHQKNMRQQFWNLALLWLWWDMTQSLSNQSAPISIITGSIILKYNYSSLYRVMSLRSA